MHYITGTQILVSSRSISRVRPGMTGQQLRKASTGGSHFKSQRAKFKPDRTYTLTRIQPIEDGVQYTFNEGIGESVVLDFSQVKEAETFISELRDESVPDYTAIYENKTD